MKKLIAIFIVVLLMSSCLCFAVSAEDATLTIAEDFQTLSYHGITYIRTNTTMVSLDSYDPATPQPQLSQKQQELLYNCVFYTDSGRYVIEAEFYYRDGTYVSCGYVAETFYEEYRKSLDSEDTDCYVWFYWDNLHKTYAKEADFKGTPITLNGWALSNAESFPVYVQNSHNGFSILKGSLLLVQDTFYYVDHDENDLYQPYCVELYDVSSLECYEISDPELVLQLETSMGSYYDLAYGTEDLLSIISFCFWTFIFALIPAAIFVLALICFIRGKGYYRLIWGLTGGFAIAELVMFLVVCLNLFLT